MTQKWKKDPSLHSCETIENNGQINKKLNYEKTYIKEFLDSDPLKDWESIYRCMELWHFFADKVRIKGNLKVLDCGTKDGQFPVYLNDLGYICTGIEISNSYVRFAKDLGRNVEYGDVCNLKYDDNTFDVVFSHHLLGLVRDYRLALKEMLRVVKPNGYIVTLNDIPGNKKKHYSYIKNMIIIENWLKEEDFIKNKIVYFDVNPNMQSSNEKILIVQKLSILEEE
jgi:SAM-dependent methyltransferase